MLCTPYGEDRRAVVGSAKGPSQSFRGEIMLKAGPTFLRSIATSLGSNNASLEGSRRSRRVAKVSLTTVTILRVSPRTEGPETTSTTIRCRPGLVKGSVPTYVAAAEPFRVRCLA